MASWPKLYGGVLKGYKYHSSPPTIFFASSFLHHFFYFPSPLAWLHERFDFYKAILNDDEQLVIPRFSAFRTFFAYFNTMNSHFAFCIITLLFSLRSKAMATDIGSIASGSILHVYRIVF